tara:strand:+ start:5431 stop:5745 length:315 start_codon:yes stop_codon:yes gene_type:complete
MLALRQHDNIPDVLALPRIVGAKGENSSDSPSYRKRLNRFIDDLSKIHEAMSANVSNTSELFAEVDRKLREIEVGVEVYVRSVEFADGEEISVAKAQAEFRAKQ